MAEKIRNRTKIIGEAAKATRGRTLFRCVVCEIPFSLPNCHAKRRGVGKYCSVLCQKKAEAERKERRSRVCPVCLQVFYPRATQLRNGVGVHCSHKCQGVAYTGEGNPMYGVSPSKEAIEKANVTRIKNGNIKYGADNPNWKSGKTLKNGYVMLSVNGGVVLEHRAVVEKAIGRKLEKHEIVHHIDENKQNNDLNNLLVTNKEEHMVVHHKYYGEKVWCAKLTDDAVRHIRQSGISTAELAGHYGVSRTAIRNAKSGKAWARVK